MELTKIFDNSKGGDPLHIAYTEAVTLANSVSVGVKDAFTFDTTTESETTVSGEYAGASLEEKLTETVHVGLAKEESKDTEESKATETGVAVEFDCPAGAIKQVHINKDHKRELIPVNGLFVVDFSIEFQLYHWWNHDAGGIKYRNEGQDTFKVDSVKGLYELMRGVDTDYPHLAGFWQDGNANQVRGPQRDSAPAGLPQPELHAGSGQDQGHREQRKLQGRRSRIGDPRRCRRGGRLVRTRERRQVHAMSAKTDPAEFADAEVVKSQAGDTERKLDLTGHLEAFKPALVIRGFATARLGIMSTWRAQGKAPKQKSKKAARTKKARKDAEAVA